MLRPHPALRRTSPLPALRFAVGAFAAAIALAAAGLAAIATSVGRLFAYAM
jgi:hypothetical protein